jgi:antitoxin component of MazEF toxin-antitoxin module
MEATVIKMGTSLGFKVPEDMIRSFNIKAGTKIKMNFIRDNEFVFRKKPKIREGWDTAFSQYAMDGEDRLILPDFLDSETDIFL